MQYTISSQLVADHHVQPLGLFEFHAKLGVGGE